MSYATILADPPWPERGSGKSVRGAQRHYDLIKKKEEMLRVMVQSSCWQPAPDCHLYMWVTNNYLGWGMWLVGALGFTYKTNVSWRKRRLASAGDLGKLVRLHKENPMAALARLHELQDAGQTGLGQYFRGGHELLLFGVKGSGPAVRTDRKDLSTVLSAPRGKHSKKPEEARALIEARSKGPYLEMFARDSAPGWDAWGKEAA